MEIHLYPKNGEKFQFIQETKFPSRVNRATFGAKTKRIRNKCCSIMKKVATTNDSFCATMEKDSIYVKQNFLNVLSGLLKTEPVRHNSTGLIFKGGFVLSRKFYVRTNINLAGLTCIKKIRSDGGEPRNVKKLNNDQLLTFTPVVDTSLLEVDFHCRVTFTCVKV